MRKKIYLLIFLVVLLLGTIYFTDGNYRPFMNLTPQDVSSISIQLEDEEPLIYQDYATIDTVTQLLQQIDILFSASPQGEPLAELDITFISGQSAHLTLYAHCLSIDDKSYFISSETSRDMLTKLETIG